MGDFVVGVIRRAHGLDGELLVSPETDEPERAYRPGRVFRVADAPTGLATRLTLESAGWQPKGWRLGFREIGDRESAESYTGCSLELPETELTELEENEFFLHDLVDLEVLDARGRRIGRVDWVFDRPGQPLLVVVDEQGDRTEERLIPFSPAIVRDVNLKAGLLRVDPPPGLLDL